MDDASLDDFLDESDASDDDEDIDETGEATDDDSGEPTDADPDSDAATADPDPDERDGEDTPAVDPGGVEPATSTYAWHGETEACAACGERVERRWRDGDQLVCAACKEW